MQWAGLGPLGRAATFLAAAFAPPHKARTYLAGLHPKGYIASGAVVYHKQLRLGKNVFVDDRAVIFQRPNGGPVELGDRVQIFRDAILETGEGASLTVGAGSSIHPRCSMHANLASIHIGAGVLIGPNCAVYSYDHGTASDASIREHALTTKGDVRIGDESWLGFGVIVLSGVRIGKGAVIGAGSVVTSDIPEYAIAAGSPARVVKIRGGVESAPVKAKSY
jgi:acetyltransferase-like isoleucine patch superfamily enzyme